MQWLFGGCAIALLIAALRDEFRPGGSLHVQLGRARRGEPTKYGFEDRDDVVVIVSSRGVEIPVGRLSAGEIVAALADIDRIEEIEVA